MARPVIASTTCATAVDAELDREFLAAADAPAFVAQIKALLDIPARAAVLGTAARQRVVASYSWDAHLSLIDPYLESEPVR